MAWLYIIKTGSTYDTFAPDNGDFEDWVRQGLDEEVAPRVRLISAHEGEALPPVEACAGVVITGSHAMVTDRESWSEAIAAWLPGVLAARVPLLAICYGHQLLAQTTGGEVGYHPQGKEVGSVPISLTGAAGDDMLFGGLPSHFLAHATHSQTVLKLPPDAVLLAANDHEPHHAFRLGKWAWGIQFHPEFTALVMREYIHQQADALQREQQNPQALIAGVRETPVAAKILRRFGGLVSKTTRGA